MRGTLLTAMASLLISACASSPAPAPQAAVAVPALVPPADGAQLRHPPRLTGFPNFDAYPHAEHGASVTGRVLVQFGVDAAGKATSPSQGLQAAAVEVVRHLKFDMADRSYDSADPAPSYLLINFCIERCEPLPPYPAEDVTVTASRLKNPN